MGYVFLSLSLFSGAVKGYCGKKISDFTNTFRKAIGANAARMFLCAVISAVLLVFSSGFAAFVPSLKALLISALSGVFMSSFVVTWLISVRRGAYMMLDVFLMLGICVPIFLSKAFFSESIKASQFIGLSLLLVSVILMCSYNNSVKSNITFSSALLLVVCGLSSGMMDFSGKLFVKKLADESVSVFNFYTYVFCVLTLVVFYLFTRKKEDGEREKGGVPLRVALYIIIMSGCMFVNFYFKTLAADRLSAVVLYPLSQGSSLILSSVMSAVFFKEKLTFKAIVGIVTAFVALLIINLF